MAKVSAVDARVVRGIICELVTRDFVGSQVMEVMMVMMMDVVDAESCGDATAHVETVRTTRLTRYSVELGGALVQCETLGCLRSL